MRTVNRALLFALFTSIGAALLLGERSPATAGPATHGPARHSIQFAISPDGQFAWVPAPDRKALRKVRLTDGLVVARHRFQNCISAVELSNDGSTLAVAFSNGDRITLLDPADPADDGRDVPAGRSPTLLEFGSEGTDLCALSPKDSEIDVIDLRTFRLNQIVPLPSSPSSMAHAGGNVAVTLPDTGELLILDHPCHNVVTTLWLSPVPDVVVTGGTADDGRAGHMGHLAPKWVPIERRTFTSGSETYTLEPTNDYSSSTATQVFVTLSREAGCLTFLDSSRLTVLGTTSVEDASNVAAGCTESPWAFVLHGKGRKISGIPLDPANPRFGTVVFTTNLDEPCESLCVGPDGICWALGVSRQRLHGVDWRQAEKARTVKIRRDAKDDEDDREF